MKRILLITLLLAFANIAHPQSITRGVAEGEIYISQRWYWDFSTNEFVHAVWHSTDHGRHLVNKYASTTMPQQGTRFDIVADATPGVLYGVNYNKLYISYDYGATWEFVENAGYIYYTSGCTQGEVYKCKNAEQGSALWRSVDYMQTYTLMNDQVWGTPEIGHSEGEIYLKRGTPLYGVYILRSTDFGATFETIPVSEEIAGTDPGGYYPVLSRGAVPGELYLVTWHLPGSDYVYRIYYSSDYGHTFKLQHQSGDTNFFYWGYNFSAGREPGSFYVVRFTANSHEGNASHVHLYIDYSTDYGQNFTTFFHDTHSGYDGNPASVVHTLTLQPNPPGGGTVQGAGRYEEGSEVFISASPTGGYEFVNWTEKDTVVSEGLEYSFPIENTRTLAANFRLVNSVGSHEGRNRVKLYPNPFTSIVTFEYPWLTGDGELRVYGVTGVIVFQKDISGNSTHINLSHLPQGGYIYTIITGGHPVYRGVMVKQ